MTCVILLTDEDARLRQEVAGLHQENLSDETEQTFDQVSSLRTRARRRRRLYRLSTEVWRWRLADGFDMDDPAYGVSIADLSPKAACRCDGPRHWRTTSF